jgi:UDP-glucose 4-epimerase
MATVVGIFEYQYKKNKPLTIVKPGTQTRRFTHIDDTINTCIDAWKKNQCLHYSISNKKPYSITDLAKLFKTKITYVNARSGERYASALTKMSNNRKIINKFGKIDLKDYVSSFIKGEKL